MRRRATVGRGHRARVGAAGAAGVALALFLGACDGPDGPGTLDARVEPGGTGAGAAVVEVTGRGIRGFEAAGDTRVFGDQLPGDPDRYRVILVNAGGGPLRFGIRVEDRGAQLPSGAVLFAADTANAPLPVSGLMKFRVER